MSFKNYFYENNDFYKNMKKIIVFSSLKNKNFIL
jgi:hypothetical protein